MGVGIATMILHACSADVDLLRAVERSGMLGRVHSLFDHAPKIESHEGELFTLVSCSLDDTPNSARLDPSDFTATAVVVGEAVSCRSMWMRIGDNANVVLMSAT